MASDFEQLLSQVRGGMVFTGPMVLALRAEPPAKTETRRIITVPKRYPPDTQIVSMSLLVDDQWGAVLWSPMAHKSYDTTLFARFAPGDLAYVKETLQRARDSDDRVTWWAHYAAVAPGPDGQYHELPLVLDVCGAAVEWEWKRSVLPARFMPKDCARTILRIGGVEAVRLQEITEAQARAEGFESRAEFFAYYDSLHKPGQLSADNPWVWRYFDLTVEAKR